MKITEENFRFIANRHYNDLFAEPEEFEEDLTRFLFIKRLLNQYQKNGVLKPRLLLNHILLLCNVFGPIAVDLLLFKLPEYSSEILACLVFLDQIGLSDPRRKLIDPTVLSILNDDIKNNK